MSRTIFLLSIIGLSLVAAHIQNNEEFNWNHEDSLLSEFNFLGELNLEGGVGGVGEVEVSEFSLRTHHNEYNFAEEALNSEGELTFDNQFNFLNALNGENEEVVLGNSENEFSFGEEALNGEGELTFDNQFNFLKALNGENEEVVLGNAENEFCFGDNVLNAESETLFNNEFNFLNALYGENEEVVLGNSENEFSFGDNILNAESETLFDTEFNFTEEVVFTGKSQAVLGNGEEEIEQEYKDTLFSIDMIKIAF